MCVSALVIMPRGLGGDAYGRVSSRASHSAKHGICWLVGNLVRLFRDTWPFLRTYLSRQIFLYLLPYTVIYTLPLSFLLLSNPYAIITA